MRWLFSAEQPALGGSAVVVEDLRPGPVGRPAVAGVQHQAVVEGGDELDRGAVADGHPLLRPGAVWGEDAAPRPGGRDSAQDVERLARPHVRERDAAFLIVAHAPALGVGPVRDCGQKVGRLDGVQLFVRSPHINTTEHF